METTDWAVSLNARQRDRRAIIAARDHMRTISISKGDNSGIHGADTHHGITDLFGYGVVPPDVAGKPFMYRQNLTLDVHGAGSVLVRIAVPDHNEYVDQKRLAAAGLACVQRMQKTARPSNPGLRNDEQKHPVFHLGIWTAQGHNTPDWTSDTKQAAPLTGAAERQAAVDDVLVWAKNYYTKYIGPYIHSRRNKYSIPDEILEQLKQRRDQFDYLCRKHPGASTLLHADYGTVTPFTTYSPESHMDPNDADFSVLANFGAGCWLVLAEYNLRVHLQPYDVVVFRSNAVRHHTEAVANDGASGARWAVSFYLHKNIQKENIRQAVQEAEDAMAVRATAAEQR